MPIVCESATLSRSSLRYVLRLTHRRVLMYSNRPTDPCIPIPSERLKGFQAEKREVVAGLLFYSCGVPITSNAR